MVRISWPEIGIANIKKPMSPLRGAALFPSVLNRCKKVDAISQIGEQEISRAAEEQIAEVTSTGTR